MTKTKTENRGMKGEKAKAIWAIPAMLGASVLVAGEEAKRGELELGVESWVRYEDWDWFGGGDAGKYDFGFGRHRLTGVYRAEGLEWVLEPQVVWMEGLPVDAVEAPPRGPAGMGALYSLHNGEDGPESFGLNRAFLKAEDLWGSGLTATLGRMSYASGLEHLRPGDGKRFNILKTLRLGDRLLSSFEWSAFGRSFDGLRLDAGTGGEDPRWSAALFSPTQGGWEKDFNETIEDIRIGTLVVTLPRGTLYEGAEASAFVIHYEDERACGQRVDNTGLACERADIGVTSLGGHLVGMHPAGPGEADYLVWGVVQTGDWYEQDHRAWSLALEAGYQWTDAPWRPWLRAGVFASSGDGDARDGDHETFFQLSPGTRKYQLFPYYDLQNARYGFLQAFLFPLPGITVRIDYTRARLAEAEDRWYMGTGPTQEAGRIFGYLARPTGGETDLSDEGSLMVRWQPLEWLTVEAFYSHVEGDAVIQSLYADDPDADYASIEARIAF